MFNLDLGQWRIALVLEDDPLRQQSIFPYQEAHLHRGAIVSASSCVRGETEADGIITNGEAVSVRTADCLPLVLVTSTLGIVLHVSRKTLIRGLLDQVPNVLPIADITGVFIGPHICQEHFTFEAEGEEIAAFRRQFPTAATDNIPVGLSLLTAVRDYLTDWGVPDSKVVLDKRCTYETPDLPSYRRWFDGGKKGSFSPQLATVLWPLTDSLK